MAGDNEVTIGGGSPRLIEFVSNGQRRAALRGRDAVWEHAPVAAEPSDSVDAIARTYFTDDADGMRAWLVFPSGAAQLLATEPTVTGAVRDRAWGQVVIQAATPSGAQVTPGTIWIDVTTPASPLLKVCSGVGPITFTDFTPPAASGSVTALDGTGSAGAAATYSRGDHKHADVNRPTDGQKAALAGSSGAPSGLNPYVTDADARNTNARTPTSHASSHQHSGSDEVATATPGANAIPKAGAGSKLAAGWISGVLAITDLTTTQTGTGNVVLATAPTLTGLVTINGQYYSPLINDGNSGAAKTVNFNDGNEHRVTLTDNVTFTFSNPVNGGRYVLLLYTGAGSFTATWPANVLWPGGAAPTITATAAKVDLVTFIYDSTADKYYGSINQNY